MKLILVFFTFLGLAFGKAIPTKNLQDDLNDFLAILPLDEILAIAMEYLSNDAQVQDAMAYLQSDSFHNIITTLESQTEFKDFIGFLKDHGLDAAEFINAIHAIIGLGPYGGAKSAKPGDGINGLINDIIAILPLDDLKALFQDKLETSPDFKALYDEIRGPEFQTLMATLRALPEYKELLQKLRDDAVDVDQYIEVIRSLFDITGGSPSTKNLKDDLNDFLALLPLDQILAIALDYLSNDAQVQEFVAYLQSDDFHTIVTTIENDPEFLKSVDFLKAHGIDAVIDYVNTFNNFIGLGAYGGAKSPSPGDGVKGLIDDIIAILPLDKLQALYQEKLQTSQDFQELVKAIQGSDFQGLISKLKAMPEYTALLDKLRDYGVDVDSFIQLLKDLLGIPSGSPSAKNLQDDLKDFLALLPLDQILAIALDYLANDAQVQEFVAYLQSDDFHAIVTKIESDPEFQKSVDFLKAHGIDAVTDYVNTFNNFIGLGAYGGAKSPSPGDGVQGLINDIIAILPLDKLQALYQDKLKTSPDFKELVEAIQGSDFQGLISKLKAMPEYTALLDKLRGYGVDVDSFIQLLKDLLGIPSGSPSAKNLQDDLNDFLALLPLDQILAIALDYLANDAQVQEFVAYLQSDDFHAIITKIESDPEFQKSVDFLKAHGIDAVTDYVNTFNNFIGLGAYGGAKSPSPGDGVQGLINDIIAILPLDKLQALYQDKLKTSPDFKELVEAIQGPDFQGLISKLKAMPEYTALLDKLRGYGVDVDSFIQLLKDLLGIPSGSPSAKNLQDDLKDFLALLPLDQILAIALDYLANDAQVKEFVAYLQSDDFHKIVTTIESDPEFQKSVDFLKAHGIDAVIDYVNTFNNFIGLGAYGGAKSPSPGDGVQGLINDIIAILPLDKLQALYQDKLKTSPDFKELVEAIQGSDFQGLISKLKAMPEYTALLDKLRGYGVDVDSFIQLLKDLLGIPSGSPSAKNLQDDLNDFLALLPLDQILAIAVDYLANDAQVQEFVAYFQSDDFHAIVTKIESDPEFQKSVDFLKAHGIDAVIDYVNTFNNFIGLGAYGGAKSPSPGDGVQGLINDIIAILPLDKLQALYQDKLKTSPDFKELVEAIQGPDFQGLINKLKAMPEYTALLDKLRGYGVDVDSFIQLLKDLLGIPSGSPSAKNLQDDLKDFLALLPLDQILAIALDYLANDAQVKEFVAYLQSDDFHKIVTTIESDPEFQKSVDFLKAHGIDAVIDYVNTFNNFIGLGAYGGAKSPSPGDGVQGLINDIIAILPLDKLQALYQDKLKTSPDFKELVEAIQGSDFQGLISKLKAMPEYTALLDKLRGYGVDVDSFIQLLKDLLGIPSGSPSAKNLQDDLNDFLALLPLDQILAIAVDYLANDAQVQEFVAYFQSDDFHAIVTKIESDPEFQKSVDFLKAHGIDAVIDYVNTFNNFIGLGAYGGAKSPSPGDGVQGLINDIIAILPLDKLKALYQEKLQTSQDFQELVKAIQGSDFQGLISKLKAMPEYTALLDKLRGYGVDVDSFIQLLKDLLGIPSGSPSAKNLQDDLNDFLALLPLDQILAIALDYLANDAQVKEFVAYLQSDDFHAIVTKIESDPEFQKSVDFLKAHGIEAVIDYVNTFNNFIGLGAYGGAKSPSPGDGVQGLINDIIAILPLDKLKALFQDKLETSPDFKELYAAIRGPDFQGMLDTLRGMPEYQELLQKLTGYGVDVEHFISVIRSLFGLE